MKGILLVNTGSPKSCCRKDVKAFVGAMLSDPKVMTVPNWLRPILVKGIILPLRQFSSTKHYNQIWDHKQNISPLLYHMQKLAAKIESQSDYIVEIAMRYEQPDIASALDRFTQRNAHIHEVIVLPMFPHYAESSYQTAVDEVALCFYKQPYPYRLRIIEPYFNHPGYIQALAQSIRPYLTENFDKLIFSFHSLPLDHVEAAWKKGKEFDYVFQIKETIRLVLKELDMDVKKTRLVYSSAIGNKWLAPDLDETIEDMAKNGKKRLLVVTPGFAVDNLETLFDVGIKATNIFIQNGGKKLTPIPCLNDNDEWVKSILDIIS